MVNLEKTINGYVKRLRGAKTLSDVRKSIEKDFYSKYGLSKKVETMAYEVADCVAEKLRVKMV